MLTRRQAAPMIRRYGRRMRQMRELQKENARLKAQVWRLQEAFACLADGDEERLGEALGLRPGDLATEPDDTEAM